MHSHKCNIENEVSTFVQALSRESAIAERRELEAVSYRLN